MRLQVGREPRPPNRRVWRVTRIDPLLTDTPQTYWFFSINLTELFAAVKGFRRTSVQMFKFTWNTWKQAAGLNFSLMKFQFQALNICFSVD